MSEIFVYVEGPSDQGGMRELLSGLISEANAKGHKIGFYPLNGKISLINKGIKKAVNILRNKPAAYVFLVPDLYPPNVPFPHRKFDEMKEELQRRFYKELDDKNCDSRLAERFFVHCFKYDFEALILASEAGLKRCLQKSKFSRPWKIPVEDQNHDKPPKRIVEDLFLDAGKKYRDTIDAPLILHNSDYHKLMEKCPQNFYPFVRDIQSLIGNS